MDPLTSAAAGGLQASMDSFDMLANNLSNASTSGFKADHEFYSTFLAPDAVNDFDPSVGEAPLVQKQWTDFSQGTLTATANTTDFALSGAGFFTVNGPKGPLYTRNGNFHFTPGGALVTAEGYPVRLIGGQTVQSQSASPLQVGPDGQVLQDGNPLGQLELASFKDQSQLGRSAGTYFNNADPTANPVTASDAQVLQGKVESSNAAPPESAVRMVSLMRQFEMLQRAIKIGTDMNRQAVQEVARVTSYSHSQDLHMIRALYSAASGMTAQQLNVDNIANNLANANTAGFKMRRAQFEDLVYQSLIQPGAAAGQQSTVPAGLQLGLGTRAAGNEIIFSQGAFSQTNNPLDMVIQGKGFFQIRQASGELAYTRAGSFQLDRNGSMVDANGNFLEPQITIPVTAQVITVAADGTVSYTLPNQTAAQKAGQITLANFQNPAGLNSIGNTLFTATDASGDPQVGTPGGSDGLGSLMQGYTEQSNVDVVEEFVNLIQSQRAYEANSRVVKAADEMYQQVNQVTS